MYKKKFSVIITAVIVMISLMCSSLPVFALASGSYEYVLEGNGVAVTKYLGSAFNVSVPSEIDGKRVVKIGDAAFRDNKTVESVTVPSGVNEIGASAFANCTALKTIQLPASITRIGENAFNNTGYYNDKANWKIKNVGGGGGIDIGGGGGDDSISWEDIIADELEVLYLGTNLIKIKISGTYYIKAGTTVIADGAFSGNRKLNKTSIPDSVVTVGERAFYGCSSLKQIDIPASVSFIGASAFEDCESLTAVTMPEKPLNIELNAFLNTDYRNNKANWEGNSLYAGKQLLATIIDRDDIVVKDGTLSMAGDTVRGNIVIPTSIAYISSDACLSPENSRIFGTPDTLAKSFADEKKIAFIDLTNILKGDIDYDGLLTLSDFATLCEIAACLRRSTYTDSIVGDMDDDGAVDAFDAIALSLIADHTLPRGDADGNGRIQDEDVELVIRQAAALQKADDENMQIRSDINGDGAVDAFDAIELDLLLHPQS